MLLVFRLATLLIVLWPALVTAQTTVTVGPVTTAMRFEFFCSPNIVPQTPAECQTYEWRLKDAGAPLTALTNVVCATPVAPATQARCVSTLTGSHVDALNRAGSHSLTLAGFRADIGQEGGPSVPFVLKAPAAAPGSLMITQ